MKKSKCRLAAKKMLKSRSNDKENLLLTTDKDVAAFNKLNAKIPEITDTNEYFLRSTKKLSVRVIVL